MLYGRAREQARIDALTAAARAGQGGAVIVRGETGIGRSALLDHAATHATGFLLLRATGVEPESELPFAALYPLLHPVLAHAGRLPADRAEALREAVKAAPPEAPDRSRTRLVGLAVLDLLADVAAEAPVLCLVDDAHWLDRASAEALLFAARRLGGERVAMILAARDDVPSRTHPAPAPRPTDGTAAGTFPALRSGTGTLTGAGTLTGTGVEELWPAGLDMTAAGELLAARAPGLPSQVRHRVAEEAAGNPLALVELAAALTPEQQAGRLGPLPLPCECGPLSGRVRATFETPVHRLPEATRAALLVAAADDTGDLDVILRAAARLGATPADLEPAERDELVRLSATGLTFRHPLFRSAAYRTAPYFRRVAAHRALADALEGEAHTTRRAWHHATVTAGPEDSLATALHNAALHLFPHAADPPAIAPYERHADGTLTDERHAEGTLTGETHTASALGDGTLGARASGEGVPVVVASVAYERAGELSAEPGRSAERLVAAAELALQAGLTGRSAALADRAAALPSAPATRARLAAVRAGIESVHGRPEAAARILLTGAHHALAAETAPTQQKKSATTRPAPRTPPEPASPDGPTTGQVPAVERGPQEDGVSAVGAPVVRPAAMRSPAVRLLADAVREASSACHGVLADAAATRLAALTTHPAAGTAAGPHRDIAGVFAAGMEVMGRMVAGRAATDLSPVRAALRSVQVSSADHPDLLAPAAWMGVASGDEVVGRELAVLLTERCRRHGLIGVLPEALTLLAQAELSAGRHGEAEAAAREGLRAASAVRQPYRAAHLHALLAWLAAVNGDEDRCRRLTTPAGAVPALLAVDGHTATLSGEAACATRVPHLAELAQVAEGAGAAQAVGTWAWGLLELGLGRPRPAVERLAALWSGACHHPLVALHAVPDLVEAAVRAGLREPAEEPAARYADWAAASGRPWARAVAARLEGLLAHDDEAGRHYARAVAIPAGQPFQQARTELLYGEWLRRAHRRSEARRYLRAAFETFGALGATPWARRAGGELQATTEPARRRGNLPGLLGRLTPQERQVVRLAAAGLSNRQIGARLLLSPRTVGHHLYKAFPKLGVASRGQLAELGILAEPEPPAELGPFAALDGPDRLSRVTGPT
ncbi:AAA family ATPase [Nonomuraea sp. 3-1Str]|uniref:AAA family ATPase n=1 Tax=Nonomuraea sp. 3-1Str TaxID=2929801 RepID=UPI0028650547|nr:AAA family ATPase [Nonomuraea sp. 3-1Str]MDR8412536.1 AAA family ATPase [Nonomuraea sp. 3-1Str]